MKYSPRQHKRDSIKKWTDKLSKANPGYKIQDNYLDIIQVINGLTTKEGTAILYLIAAAYGVGCQDTSKTPESI